MPDETKERDPQLMVFRPTEALRRRLDAGKAAVARRLDQTERSITGQIELVWLLNYALDALEVPRVVGSLVDETEATEDDALNGRR